MSNLPSDNEELTAFEKLIADSLGPGSLPDFSPDDRFLNSLNRKLNQLSSPASGGSRTWLNGIYQGAAAAAFGFILFTALNVLPPVFVNTSVTGAGIAQKTVVEATLRSRILWQQFIVYLGNQARSITEI